MKNRLEIVRKFAKMINSDDINQIILFGSVACGEDTEDSDINILLVSSYGRKLEPLIEDEVFRVMMEDEEMISAHVISEKNFNETKNFSFLSNVLNDGIVIG